MGSGVFDAVWSTAENIAGSVILVQCLYFPDSQICVGETIGKIILLGYSSASFTTKCAICMLRRLLFSHLCRAPVTNR